MLKIKSISLILITILTLLSLFVFDYFAKPQSDDWGWIAFVKENGMIGAYNSMRETNQSSPFMLLVMFPIVHLQTIIPYYFLLFAIQLTLPITLFLLFSRLIVNSLSLESRLRLFLVILNLIILTFLTSWNSNTFQNAVFWLTGVLAYVLPISMFFILIDKILKVNRNFFDKVVVFVLAFLLSGVQINYIATFGIVFILFLYFRVIRVDKFLWILIGWALVSIVYTWSYPGWLTRLPVPNDLTIMDMGLNFLKLYIIGFLKEPIWSLSLFIFILYFMSDLKSVFNTMVSTQGSKRILPGLLFGIVTISIVFQIFAFNGSLGYGRVHFLTHLLMVMFIVSVLTFFVENIFNQFVKSSVGSSSLFIIVIVLYLIPLRLKFYKAKRFSDKWKTRDLYVKQSKITERGCIEVFKLPRSGILGYVDLNESVLCSSLVGCQGKIEYGKIVNYDHWVHKMHYGLTKNIIVQPVNYEIRDK
jgi:hypothetical protein